MRIGVISAMEAEHQQLIGRLENKRETRFGCHTFSVGALGCNEVALMQCNIGKVNAALGAQSLIMGFQPQCVISTGVAGGIDSSLRITDIVASRQVVYHDVWCGEGNEWGQVQGLPTFMEGHAALLSHAVSLNQTKDTESRIHAGLICSGDQFIQDERKLASIKNHFPNGLAVDMESGAIAQTCLLHGVPFLSFRIISDVPGAGNDNFAQYQEFFWGDIAKRSFHTTWTFLSTLPASI